MTDEQKNKSPDDEYQFPQDEYVSPESEGETHLDENVSDPAIAEMENTEKLSIFAKIMQQLRALPLLKNKRMLIIIGAVIVVIVGFRLMRGSEPVQPVITPKPVAAVTTPAPQPIMPITPIEQPSRAESQIKELQAQISDMQNTINQTQAANQALQKTVTDLTTEVQTLTAQLSKKAVSGPAKKGYSVFFHLRAVLPDRAWITSNTGKELTVTVGDDIRGYGTVRVIDAQQGIIETSSGRKIEYGTNDY